MTESSQSDRPEHNCNSPASATPIEGTEQVEVGKITRILNEIRNGDPKAADHFMTVVYQELRYIARAKFAKEATGHTSQPTALAHDALLKLMDGIRSARFENRAHFFAAAAEVMRRFLVDHARAKHALRRGGTAGREELDPDYPDPKQAADADKFADLLLVNESLSRLAEVKPEKAELVKLRYFLQMTLPEAAEVLAIDRSTADAWWRYAKTWLKEDIRRRGSR